MGRKENTQVKAKAKRKRTEYLVIEFFEFIESVAFVVSRPSGS
jgi:hypothetical protein